MTEDRNKSDQERQDEDEILVVEGEIVDDDEGRIVKGEIVDDERQVIEGEVVDEGQEEIDELMALRQQLETAQTQAEEYLDDLRRERAAFQNYKKRQENERAGSRQRAQADLLVQILPILDDMERALEAVPEDQAEQPWLAGMSLIQRKLQGVLRSAGVDQVQAEPGQPFDPFIHEAISQEENEDFEEGEIIAAVQKGYELGERVLRPAMVRVAK